MGLLSCGFVSLFLIIPSTTNPEMAPFTMTWKWELPINHCLRKCLGTYWEVDLIEAASQLRFCLLIQISLRWLQLMSRWHKPLPVRSSSKGPTFTSELSAIDRLWEKGKSLSLVVCSLMSLPGSSGYTKTRGDQPAQDKLSGLQNKLSRHEHDREICRERGSG